MTYASVKPSHFAAMGSTPFSPMLNQSLHDLVPHDIRSSDSYETRSADYEKIIEEEDEAQIQELADEEYFKAYKTSTRYFVLIILFMGNVLVNVDHGSLIGGMKGIQETSQINNWSFGVLGSVVYIGLTIGSAAATGVYAHGDLIKTALSVSLLLNAVTLILFSSISSFYT